MRFDFRYAIEHGALEIELHHYAQSLRESGVHADWEIERTNSPMLDQPAERGQRLSELAGGILLGVVTLLLRAENSFHLGAVIEERKEDGNTLDDGSP